MPRFVLLYHDCPLAYARQSHWDFMLESDSVLRTWAVAALPAAWSAAREQTTLTYPGCAEASNEDSVAVVRLGDHRTEYLTIEGTVGGGRGDVRRIDAGVYEELCDDDRSITVRLNGRLLRGRVTLDAGRLIVAALDE